MGKSRQTFSKSENEKKRKKKQQEKQEKREARKENAKEGSLDNMIAYVDEYGNISDTPPDPSKKKKIKAENIEIGVPKREKVDKPSVRKGRLDFFNTDKGYGFIKELDSNESYFVHINEFTEDIRENDVVIFELERGMKGMNAVRVKLAPKA